ncbi:hypothetical protein A8C56_07775 [Niabella ginsenosidivorans]|uniref:Uncharacterized protein n=1 Tax=Niabella ginsenosidivorans TaxID=1176587 RepID=A0A1A9I2F5_9BACT|nr:hypothetical protein A8C56_07775 [Niabella ginsenosidivorans]
MKCHGFIFKFFSFAEIFRYSAVIFAAIFSPFEQDSFAFCTHLYFQRYAAWQICRVADCDSLRGKSDTGSSQFFYR